MMVDYRERERDLQLDDRQPDVGRWMGWMFGFWLPSAILLEGFSSNYHLR